jgi:hypothetical protein
MNRRKNDREDEGIPTIHSTDGGEIKVKQKVYEIFHTFPLYTGSFGVCYCIHQRASGKSS